MFGIDLGINIASITLTSQTGFIIDHFILFGPKRNKNLLDDDWNRVTKMSSAICDCISDMIKARPNEYTDVLATIEEPIYSSFNRNVRGILIIAYMYALVRHRLSARGFKIFSANPVTIKSMARLMAFPNKRLKAELCDKQGKLTKKGMIRAYKKINNKEPPYHTTLGRETLADSYFIARVGIEKAKLKRDKMLQQG